MKDYDVIVIGGSYSGLSAALSLGRSRRGVLLIDSGEPCNLQTPHSHNFLTQDGKTPQEILEKAKADVSKYESVHFLSDKVIRGNRLNETSFQVQTSSGNEFTTSKLLFGTGITDSIPDIHGFQACWGISIIHCPYCHGFENCDKRTGIYGNGVRVMHLVSLVLNLTKDIVILSNGPLDIDVLQVAKLKTNKIEIIELPIHEILQDNGQMKEVVFKTGKSIQLEIMYAILPFVQHSNIPESLGCEFSETGHIKVNSFQKTSVEGVYACGDNSSMMRAVSSAVYTGNIAGAFINAELANENLVKESTMIEVFITDIKEESVLRLAKAELETKFKDIEVSVDLGEFKEPYPCGHSIIRVEGLQVISENVIRTIERLGYKCEVLEGKICK